MNTPRTDMSTIDMTPGPPRASLRFERSERKRAYGARIVTEA